MFVIRMKAEITLKFFSLHIVLIKAFRNNARLL